MRRPVWLLSLGLAIALGAGSAAAAGISVGLHEVVRVSLRGVPANIVIADPQVADVNVTDPHNLVIVGKGYGVTDILVTDHAGRVLMNSRVAVGGGGEDRVTIYRGPTESGWRSASAADYNCSSGCQKLEDAAAAAPTDSQPPTNVVPPRTMTGPPIPTSTP